MINNKSVLCLIPARSGSKGLPGKNIRPLGGKPLLAWPILAALGTCCVDSIVVSTDSEHFASIAREYGASTPFIRPAELAKDNTSSIQVVEHALKWLSDHGQRFDNILLLEPTSPLTESSDIENALTALEKRRTQADAIVGVSLLETSHPSFSMTIDEQGLIRPAFPELFSSGRRQDLSHCYKLDGSLYASDTEVLLRRKSFYHERTMGHAMPKWKSFEIDDLVDFYCVESLLTNKTAILEHLSLKGPCA